MQIQIVKHTVHQLYKTAKYMSLIYLINIEMLSFPYSLPQAPLKDMLLM